MRLAVGSELLGLTSLATFCGGRNRKAEGQPSLPAKALGDILAGDAELGLLDLWVQA
jgi:hypothetical protein